MKLRHEYSGYMEFWWYKGTRVYIWDPSTKKFEVTGSEGSRSDPKFANNIQQHMLIDAIWSAKKIEFNVGKRRNDD